MQLIGRLFLVELDPRPVMYGGKGLGGSLPGAPFPRRSLRLLNLYMNFEAPGLQFLPWDTRNSTCGSRASRLLVISLCLESRDSGQAAVPSAARQKATHAAKLSAIHKQNDVICRPASRWTPCARE